MKIIRRPRPYPPSDINHKDIEMATQRGVVDLSKVRKAKEKHKEERIAQTASMRKTLARKRNIATYFTDLYKEIIGGKYDLRPSRFVKRKIRGKNAYRGTTVNSDMERLWAIFHYVQTRYDGSVSEYKEYLEYIFDKLMDIGKVSKRSIIGYIENKERIDEFFFEVRRQNRLARKANDVRRRAETHSKYFDDER